MKRVSFNIARAIKEAGYPQDLEVTDCGYALNTFGYYDEPYDCDALFNYHRTHEGEFLHFANMCRFSEGSEYCVAPTYLEVWLWLWREKRIKIELSVLSSGNVCPLNQYIPVEEYSCPEEAIIAAIEYLIDNDLIE